MSTGLRAGTNNDGYLQVNGTDVLTALSSGRIGIGTDTPTSDFHLETSSYPTLKIQNTSSASGFPVLQLIDNRSNGISLNIENGRYAGTLNIRDNTSVVDRITLTSTGNVGIGTTNPAAKLDVNGDVFPTTDATHDLGSASKRWANIYSADLQLSNEGSQNDVDGTWGTYTIQEGEDDLFLLNRRNGKKYKFVLQEVN